MVALTPHRFVRAVAAFFAAACVHCGGGGSGSPSQDAQASIPIDANAGWVDDAPTLGRDAGVEGLDATSPQDAPSRPVDANSIEAAPSTSDGGVGRDSDAGAGPYSPCPTDGGPCKILPLGDSITYGLQYAGAYRVKLFQDTLNAHQNITFVGDPSLANGPATVGGVPFPQDNQGHSGWTIDQIAGLVPSPALQTNPDVVLLMIGTNDMYSQTQPVAQAPQRLAALIDKILGDNARLLLVVAQITPLQNSAWEAQVKTYNAAIPALIQARAAAGKHIALVDMHTGFVVATMLSSDGVHPNMTGYDHMGDVWYAAIKNVVR